ncbi:hypothetical protein ACGFNP_11230 [Nonomuraea sp. NPDC049269]|uniref:hypothetical protein n=1 Tax=Nonomuraea sp. NPDC049269 TaxID=3364349 RepID=UPI003714128C
MELIERLGRLYRVTYIPAQVWLTEVHKRNSYLIGRDGDWYCVIDGDELVVGDVRRGLDAVVARNSMSASVARSHEHIGINTPLWVTKLYRHQEGLHYCRSDTTVLGSNDSDVRIDGYKVTEFRVCGVPGLE